MAVEKKDKRIVIYLTESEHQAVTWAAEAGQAAGSRRGPAAGRGLGQQPNRQGRAGRRRRPGLTPGTEPQHGGPPVALAQGMEGVAGRGRWIRAQSFDSRFQAGGGGNPTGPELAAFGQLLE